VDLESWRQLAEYWTSTGHDARHLDIPDEVSKQLGIERDNDMTTDNTPIAAHEPLGAKWKRKAYFDGLVCGLQDCTKPAEGYVCDLKPTKSTPAGRLWFGPACTKCVRKTHESLVPMTLAELAHQRNGASDLALVLDVEVGEILKRLEAAGIDEKGRPLVPVAPVEVATTPAPAPAREPPEPTTPAEMELLPIAASKALDFGIQMQLAPTVADAEQTLAMLVTFNVVDQRTMDGAAAFLKDVKAKWKAVDEIRKTYTKPLRDRIEEIQGLFNGPLGLLLKVETVLKQKIADGSKAATERQRAALHAAQMAHQAGNYQATALASQQAVASDVVLPQGINMRTVRKFRIANPALLPQELWSWVPDEAKIQAVVDAGYVNIPGVDIWDEPVIAARTTA
jgi:hypothetical protein